MTILVNWREQSDMELVTRLTDTCGWGCANHWAIESVVFGTYTPGIACPTISHCWEQRFVIIILKCDNNFVNISNALIGTKSLDAESCVCINRCSSDWKLSPTPIRHNQHLPELPATWADRRAVRDSPIWPGWVQHLLYTLPLQIRINSIHDKCLASSNKLLWCVYFQVVIVNY